MVDFSRRSFLGGAISLLAATTFVPTISAGSNLPRIFGNGRDYDSEGFQALFDGKETIFQQEQVGVSDCRGVIIHSGNFVIDREVFVHEDRPLILEQGNFNGTLLRPDEAFFCLPWDKPHGPSYALATNIGGTWTRAKGAQHWGRWHGDGNQLMLRTRAGDIYGMNRQHIANVPYQGRIASL